MTTVNSNLVVGNTDVITFCDLIKHTVHYASKQKFCFAVSYLNTYVIKFWYFLFSFYDFKQKILRSVTHMLVYRFHNH